MDLLNKFSKVEVETPVDIIIRQIRSLILSGALKPGEKLPSERKLSETFGVGRTYVRDAIKKLEFFGILKALPQSGTIVTGTDIRMLEGLFANIIKLNKNDFFHLVETRVLLEKESAKLAAQRRTEQNIEELWDAYYSFENEVKQDKAGVDEDFQFHLKIAEASQNPVIKSLMLIIIPDILGIYRKFDICGAGRYLKSMGEHREIIKMIEIQDEQGSMQMMEGHLSDVLEFSRKNPVAF
jgi:GntR family transcriptional regulator, transcriptional repressor for pyruvate dehydrogenase complex